MRAKWPKSDPPAAARTEAAQKETTEHEAKARTVGPERRVLSGCQRLAVALLAFGLSVPLAVATRLEPDSRGHGTHQQLGFPPCTFWVVFGRRCPLCGMTTAWAHLLRGNPRGAIAANAGGTLLCLLTIAAVPWLAVATAAGRWLGRAPGFVPLAWAAAVVALVTFLDWGFKLWAG